MKWVLRILGGLVVLLVIAVLVINAYLGRIVQEAVPRLAPGILGVPVELDGADIRLIRGIVKLNGLRIGNPEGFKSDYAFEMESLDILIDPASVLSDEIVIRHVHIDDPEITFEQTLKGSNFGAIQEGLAAEETAEEPAPEEEAAAEGEDAAPAKTVVIDDFQLRSAQMNVSLPGMMGKAVPIPLPPVVMEDVGRDEGGISPVEMVNKVFTAIFSTMLNVIKGSADLLGDGVKAVGGLALDVGQGAVKTVGAVGDGAVKTVGAVGDGAVKTVGAVGEGAAKSVGAVGDGAAKTVGAVGEGAGKVLKGVGGLLGGGSKEEADAAEATPEAEATSE